MAQKRLLDKKISINEQVSMLPIMGQLLFTWMIPHADDFGLLSHNPLSIKALVVPAHDITKDQVAELLELMEELQLIRTVDIDGEQYYQLTKFNDNQTLRHDRMPQTILKIKLPDNPQEAWKVCESSLSHDNDMTQTWHSLPEVKGSEVKKDNTGENRPEIKTNGVRSVGDILGVKVAVSPHVPKDGIYTEYQEKALRYADELDITLDKKNTPRWVKVFKQAHNGRNAANLERAYSYLRDVSLPSDEKMLMFFKIYENGLTNFEKERT